MTFNTHFSSIVSRKLTGIKALCFVGALAAAGAANAAVYPTSNLLANPSFETNSLTGIGNVIGPPFSTNIWGYEVATITTATGGVTPNTGTQMLSETTDGLTATQTLQLVDLSAYSTDITAGGVKANFNAQFNANLPAAIAGIVVQFYDASHNPTGSTSNTSLTLDNNAVTWQQISLANLAVPTNTKYVGAQVLYNDASLAVNGQNNPGFVDDAFLSLDRTNTPEPSALLAMIPAGVMLLIRRRRKTA